MVAGEINIAGHLNETVVEERRRVGSTEAIHCLTHVERIEKGNGGHHVDVGRVEVPVVN